MSEHVQYQRILDHRAAGLIEECGSIGTGLFVWLAVGTCGGFGAYSNLGPAWTDFGVTESLLLAALFCFHKPAESNLKLSMLGALRGAASLGLVLNIGLIAVRIGWAFLSGELKREGLATLPAASLFAAAIGAFVALAVVRLVDWAVRKDVYRSNAWSAVKTKEPVSESRGDEAQSADPKARDDSRDQNYRHPNTDRKSSRHAGGDRRYHDRSRSDENRGSTGSSSGARANESRSEQARRPSGQDGGAEAWWTILQVDPTATLSQVEAAYKTLLRQYHPDLHMGLAPRLKEAAETETKRITAAREQAKRALSRT
ncbi:MAG: DnaJ domain-containing protein [Novosphingobium sp.]|nr:DnaJ domain-containing protein [Novosphingobium sp.]